MYTVYQVQNGDTLEKISNKLGVMPSVLMELNGLKTNTIMPGTYLVIPHTNNMFFKYIVKKGDNIYEIARKYNIDPIQLLKLNGLKDTDIIYPNQEILIPGANVKIYVTSEGDTLNKVVKELGTDADNIQRQNETIYLLPDQLISIKNLKDFI